MFGKSKVSQSMIDAVNSVLEVKVEQKDTTQPSDSLRAPMAPAQTNQAVNLSEASEKVPTPTGTKVYGSSYGNSKKARQDQTKSSVDTLKGPKAKEMKEAAKPDFLDMDKDGNKKESMKKAVSDKNKVSEELKGNQHKIDANNNNKIDGQDFQILRGKKKVKEDMSFGNKLLEMVRKSDIPAYLRKAKGDTPLTVADVKAPKKDTISDPKNLAKARNEEVEGYIESLDEEMDKSQNPKGTKSKSIADPKKLVKTMSKLLHKSFEEPMKKVRKSDIPAYLKARNEEVEKESCEDEVKKHEKRLHGKDGEVSKHVSKMHKEEIEELTEEQLDEMINEVLGKDATAGDYISDFIHSDNPKFAGKSKAERKKMALGAYYGKQNETYQAADTAVTTDTLAGRMPGGKANSFKSYKLRVRPLDKEGTQMNKAPEVKQPVKTSAMKSHEVHEATIAGLSGWKKVEKNVKDKSGAVHTPMSRAKDLARAAFKDIQSKTKVK